MSATGRNVSISVKDSGGDWRDISGDVKWPLVQQDIDLADAKSVLPAFFSRETVITWRGKFDFAAFPIVVRMRRPSRSERIHTRRQKQAKRKC